MHNIIHNKKFCLIIWLCLVFLIAKSANAIVINEIMYNPDGTDSGREWIELYNDEAFDIDISEWRLYENDINHGLTISQGDLVIPGNGYAVIADNSDNFLVDYPDFNEAIIDSAFSLSNLGELICIKDNSLTFIDCVNYSTNWGADGNGKTLERKNPYEESTEDNWAESILDKGTPGMKNSVSNTSSEQNSTAEPKTISISVNVIGKKPSINNITVSPDYYSKEGFQIMPNAGENREITISAVVGDDESIDDIISVTATINNNDIELLKKETINEYEAFYEGKTNMGFYDTPGTYTVEIKAVDNSSSEEIKTAEFEYLELLAVDINFDNINFGDITSGANKFLNENNGLIIHNLGNLVSDIEISGTDLINGEETIDISNLQYQFSDFSFAPLLNIPTIADINLGCGESSYENMNLRLYIPEETKIGSYSSSITMTAIAD